MSRLLVHVEGQTEETFVNELLAPHLMQLGFASVSARLVGNARLRERRGGIKPWTSVKNDICRHLKEDSNCFASTMVDYYALPAHGDRAWPGRAVANHLAYAAKVQTVEDEISSDLANTLNHHQTQRFIPFVVMHEFEALLFSDCTTFASSIGRPHLAGKLQAIRDQFATPEEINDSPQTAPSKRIEGLIPGYEKPLFGNLAALEIGLATMRNECPRFSSWIGKLEALV